jgi:hypothetical protein
MRRVRIAERADWQAAAEAQGFTFHHEGGQRYWDERAAYLFSLEQIERDIETPTEELHAMCLDLVATWWRATSSWRGSPSPSRCGTSWRTRGSERAQPLRPFRLRL